MVLAAFWPPSGGAALAATAGVGAPPGCAGLGGHRQATAAAAAVSGGSDYARNLAGLPLRVSAAALATVAAGRWARRARSFCGASAGRRGSRRSARAARSDLEEPQMSATEKQAAKQAEEERLQEQMRLAERAQEEDFDFAELGLPEDFVPDRTDFKSLLLTGEDLNYTDEDGVKWCWIDGKWGQWVKDSEVGKYRFTDGGYESRDENGNWVSTAQMPDDVSHLTAEQLERLVKELRGEIKADIADVDLDEFRPMPAVPPLEKWPFYQVDITDEVKITDEDLKKYHQCVWTKTNLMRAFMVASKWKLNNEARRHLGYGINSSIQDVAEMNSVVIAYKCMCDQLKRIARYWNSDEEARAELVDAFRLENMEIHALIGCGTGSAIAMWYYVPGTKIAKVDLCLGDDVTEKGPFAEEAVLRWVAKLAAEMGAVKLWVRTRRTESGRVFAPPSYERIGLTKVPAGEMDLQEEWEVANNIQPTGEDLIEQEAIPQLSLWLSSRGLDHYLKGTNEWVQEVGAIELSELKDNLDDLIEYLQEKHGMTEEEVDAMKAF